MFKKGLSHLANLFRTGQIQNLKMIGVFVALIVAPNGIANTMTVFKQVFKHTMGQIY